MNLMDKYRAELKAARLKDKGAGETLAKTDRVDTSDIYGAETGKKEPTAPCPVCREYAWWLSVYGALRCGCCSPPASLALVRRWIGDPEAYARLKTARPAVVLSLDEIRERKNTN
jgi:hypothetical protein